MTVARSRDFAIPPDIAGHQRADDRRGALGFRVGDVFAHVPAKRMDRFRLVGDRILSLLGFIADAAQRTTRTVVVMAKLHQDKVARLEYREYVVPVALRDKTACAGAADSSVYDIDLGGIEGGRERISPAKLPVVSVAAAISHGGVADQKQRR